MEKEHEYLNNLEVAIDRRGLSEFLQDVAAICVEKAVHLAVNWQDYDGERVWERAASKIEKLAADQDIRVVF